MAFYQEVLKDFIAEKLNENTKEIVFNTKLFSDIRDDDFGDTTNVENTFKVETKRYVPTMITRITGEYIPIPNLNGTTNSVEIMFDLAVDNMSGLKEEDEFVSVDYDNTLLAIDEFRANILSKYHPLGTSNLMFGGEDSESVLGGGVAPYVFNTFYLKLLFKNIDEETIFVTNGATVKKLLKTGTKLQFYIDAVLVSEIDYEIDVVTELLIYYVDSTDFWHMTDGTNTDTQSTTALNSTLNEITIGDTTGVECVLQRVLTGSDEITPTEAESALDGNLDTIIDEPVIDMYDFGNKTIITNKGSSEFWSGYCSNCLLWGSDGNVVFQVYPLAPAGVYKSKNGINYHSFSLQLEAFIGDNFIFGNNFEYFIDDIQVYPVDRNHTFGAEVEARQGINSNQMEFLASESGIEFTQTFFYQPTKQLTGLLKKITTGEVDQNTIYELKVQYPFFTTEYNVIVTGGGLNTDLNSITTFTLQFKRVDSILVT